jgi:hypothetical protein
LEAWTLLLPQYCHFGRRFRERLLDAIAKAGEQLRGQASITADKQSSQ